MTLRGEIAQGENVALEFKEARPKDSLKYHKAPVINLVGMPSPA